MKNLLCAVGLIKSVDFLFKESASTCEFGDLRFIIFTVFLQISYFLLTLGVLIVADWSDFFVESLDFFLKRSFLYLKFSDGKLQLRLFLCKLLDLFVGKCKFRFDIFHFLVIFFLHSGLFLRYFSAHSSVVLSQRLNSSL